MTYQWLILEGHRSLGGGPRLKARSWTNLIEHLGFKASGMSTYAEKAAAYQAPSGYSAVQGGYDASADYYRQQQYVGQAAYPQGYTAQTYAAAPQYMMPQQGLYGYHVQQDPQAAGRMNSFNAVAPPPNFSRPPPGKDDYQNTGMSYDSSAQSSMAYTASWATPGVPQIVGDFGQWNNPDQGGDSGVTSGGSNPYGQTMDQFSKMNINDQQSYDNPPGAWGQIDPQPQHNTSLTNQAQWPGLDQANERMNKDKKREEREKRQLEAPAKDLTWEERLKRAQGAKERAENPRFEKRGEESERGGRGGSIRGGRGGFRGGFLGRGPRDGDENQRDNRFNNGQRRPPMQNGESDGGQSRGGMRGGMGGRGGLGMQQGGTPQAMLPQQMGMYQRAPQGLMPIPPHYLPPGAPMPGMMTGHQSQDQRFRNSWLDANLFGPFPMPMPPMRIGMEMEKMMAKNDMETRPRKAHKLMRDQTRMINRLALLLKTTTHRPMNSTMWNNAIIDMGLRQNKSASNSHQQVLTNNRYFSLCNTVFVFMVRI
ncbi:unnamed protein product, partial [Mesorhabditis belari]|uniref:Uncharacterized protein n=1 Tax=Mesorhabditis belari TaxID=2138241 RepID=A0AAF3FKW9_9BILA